MQPVYLTLGTALACIGGALIGVGAALALQGTTVVATPVGYACDDRKDAADRSFCRTLYETSGREILARNDPTRAGLPDGPRSPVELSETDPDTRAPAYGDRREALIVLFVCGGLSATAGLALVYAGTGRAA